VLWGVQIPLGRVFLGDEGDELRRSAHIHVHRQRLLVQRAAVGVMQNSDLDGLDFLELFRRRRERKSCVIHIHFQ
jgi:hypothetical protein